MFNTKIDVAKIMEKIKADVAAKHSGSVISQGDRMPTYSNADHSADFDAVGIKNELERIDSYITNTNADSENYYRIGDRIRISDKAKGLVRKIKIFFKRFFRKATRFIAEDQIVVNTNTINSIRALLEYNRELLPVIDLVFYLHAQNTLLNDQVRRLSEELENIKRDTGWHSEALEKFKLDMGAHGEVFDKFKLDHSEALEKLKLDMGAHSEALEKFKLDMGSYVESQNNNIAGVSDKLQAFLDEQNKPILSDEMYEEFLDKYRGSREEISRRLNVYFDEFNNFNIDPTRPNVIVDIGCGRGEMLECAYKRGISCVGVDINEACCNYCKDRGFNAVHSDAVEYLSGLEGNSVDAVTAFQLIEHISTDMLNNIIKEALRVLKPGGMLIMETPYSRNVEVGTYSFYIDPTHRRPVNGDFVKFLCEERGYSSVSFFMWKEKEIEAWLNSVYGAETTKALESPTFRTVLEEAKKALFASPDYAIIAVK
ncbi:MAG: class I SAM-dependent methyltransferase [Oscillospiraceae bacterium]|nr:class I SAM-dependent methyltransferase [Oscillospiraceae bacterium]